MTSGSYIGLSLDELCPLPQSHMENGPRGAERVTRIPGMVRKGRRYTYGVLPYWFHELNYEGGEVRSMVLEDGWCHCGRGLLIKPILRRETDTVCTYVQEISN